MFKSKEFGDFVGISKRQINNYRQEGMPSTKRNTYYYYNFESIEWLFINGKKELNVASQSVTPLQTPKSRKDLAEAKLKEHDLMIRTGEYVLKSTVDDDYFKAFRATRDRFLSLSNRVSPLLTKVQEDLEIKEIIDNEVRRILLELSECQ